MIHYFLDTSAFIRLYMVEAGSKRVRDMLRSAEAMPPACRLLVSELIHPEAASALGQASRSPDAAARGLSKLAAKRAMNQITLDLGLISSLAIIRVTGLMPFAADLVWKHRITGADAVHLAAALKSREKLKGWSEFHFVSSDRRLNAAASNEGLDVLDPTV